jgi:peptide deformylase
MHIPKKLVPPTDSILTAKAQTVDTGNLILLSELSDGLNRALKRTSGIGLALPQLGISLCGFQLTASLFSPAQHKFCFNPAILNSSFPEIESIEGCLSLPGEQYIVPRSNTIEVVYTNKYGKTITEKLTGLPAIAFQHEFDHLNGILISKGRKVTA